MQPIQPHQLKKTQWFTIVEVLVASVILGSVFFAILNLLSNNARQANMLESSREMDSLFLSSKACLRTFGLATLSGMTTTGSVNFWSDNLGCQTGSYNPDLTFSGITLTTSLLDGTGVISTGSVTYWNYFKNTPTASGSVKVASYITDGTETKSYEFEVWR